VFGALNQITDVVNVFGFEAVGRTNGKFEIVNRTQQYRINLWGCTLRRFDDVFGTFECSKYRNLIHQDTSRLANRFLGVEYPVGFDIKYQFVEVSALFNTGAFDRVAHTTYRT